MLGQHLGHQQVDQARVVQVRVAAEQVGAQRAAAGLMAFQTDQLDARIGGNDLGFGQLAPDRGRRAVVVGQRLPDRELTLGVFHRGQRHHVVERGLAVAVELQQRWRDRREPHATLHVEHCHAEARRDGLDGLALGDQSSEGKELIGTPHRLRPQVLRQAHRRCRRSVDRDAIDRRLGIELVLGDQQPERAPAPASGLDPVAAGRLAGPDFGADVQIGEQALGLDHRSQLPDALHRGRRGADIARRQKQARERHRQALTGRQRGGGSDNGLALGLGESVCEHRDLLVIRLWVVGEGTGAVARQLQ